MGNCLKCFQTSATTSTTTTANTTTTSPSTAVAVAASLGSATRKAASSTTTDNILNRGLTELARIDSNYFTSNTNNAQDAHRKLVNQQLGNNIGRITATGTTTANNVTCGVSEGRYGGVGIGLALGTLLQHNRRNFIYGEQSHETEDLLASKSPLKVDNNCDTKRSSFKLSLGKLNANCLTMGDIITTETHEISDNALNLLFEAYKDPDVDMILTDGIEQLCQDLNYEPDEFAILVLAWCLDASQMCQFTKAEFIGGLHKICADSIKTIRIRLEQTIELLRVDSEMFKQLYRFTFRFGLEPDQRILSLEMAISLWKLVFTVHTPELMKNWLNFLEKNPSIRGIPKDTWNMFLNFSEQCDINNYDDTEAWPSLFDDFVDYEKSRINDDKLSLSIDKLNNGDDDDGVIIHDDDNNNDNSANTSSLPSTSTAVSELALEATMETKKNIGDTKTNSTLAS